jgi:hypothetical protein
MSQIIFNGGDPIKDCPEDWITAELWEQVANKATKQSESPVWRFDCGFKLDFDGPIVSFESRFYPPQKRTMGLSGTAAYVSEFLTSKSQKKNLAAKHYKNYMIKS